MKKGYVKHRAKYMTIDEAKSYFVAALNEVVKPLHTKLDNYIVDDTNWKKENEPYLKGLANLTGTAKIGVWIAIGISSVGGAFIMLRKLFFNE